MQHQHLDFIWEGDMADFPTGAEFDRMAHLGWRCSKLSGGCGFESPDGLEPRRVLLLCLEHGEVCPVGAHA